MKLKKYKLLIIFITLLLLVSGAWLYYIKVYKKSHEKKEYYSDSDSLFLRLKENPSFLIQENLLQIKSISLLEFFRTRMLYHTYTNSNSPERHFADELEIDFPGERGRVLVELLTEYRHFEKEKEKVLLDIDLDGYEKILKIEMIRVEIFGENLSKLLFPEKDSEKIEKFFAYSERYLKNHYTDMPRSKKNHLMKARREIYSDGYERLFATESTQRQFALELKINERELSILNEYEKKQAINDLKEKMKKEE